MVNGSENGSGVKFGSPIEGGLCEEEEADCGSTNRAGWRGGCLASSEGGERGGEVAVVDVVFAAVRCCACAFANT